MVEAESDTYVLHPSKKHHRWAGDVMSVRGYGPSLPKGPTWDTRGQLGADVREAFLGLHLNRPLLGQRVFDVLAAWESAKKKEAILGLGPAGVVALHAAALDTRVKALTLEDSLISWQSVLDTPLNTGQLASVIPGALAYYDLPDLAGLIAPRPLTIRNPVDAAGKPISKAEAEKVYAGARRAYEKLKAADKFKIEVTEK